MASVEPKMQLEPGGQSDSRDAEVMNQLVQQQLLVQNMLLDPQAQPVSEPLMQLSQNLQELEQELRRHQSTR